MFVLIVLVPSLGSDGLIFRDKAEKSHCVPPAEQQTDAVRGWLALIEEHLVAEEPQLKTLPQRDRKISVGKSL